jgi:hypothetical protein
MKWTFGYLLRLLSCLVLVVIQPPAGKGVSPQAEEYQLLVAVTR